VSGRHTTLWSKVLAKEWRGGCVSQTTSSERLLQPNRDADVGLDDTNLAAALDLLFEAKVD